MPGNFEKTMRQVPNAAAVRRYAGQFNGVFAEMAKERFDEAGLYENLITLVNDPNWRNLILQTQGMSKAQMGQLVMRLPSEARYALRDTVLNVFKVQNISILIQRIKDSNSRFDLWSILHDNMDITEFMDSRAGSRHEGLYWILSDLADMVRSLEFILEFLSR